MENTHAGHEHRRRFGGTRILGICHDRFRCRYLGGIRKREAQHETLRRTIESGQALDPKLAEKILSQGRDRLDLDLKVAGLITLFIAPGIAMLGWFLSFVSPEATMPLYGAAVLTGFVSAGLLLASRAIERSDKEDESNFGR